MKKTSQVNRRSLIVEGLEERRVLAASVGWDGPGQGRAELSYYIGQAPSGMGQGTFETAVETALKAWSDVANIKFSQTTQAGLNNSLDFSSINIDGSGGTLAQAYFPPDLNRGRIAGDVQFDATERWEVGNALGIAAFDLVLVAAHEIGHALGLDHTNDTSAVLYPSVSPTQSFVGLDAHDVSAIRSLYSSRVGAATVASANTNTSTNTGSGPTTNSTLTNYLPTRTTRFTPHSWFANWYNRFGGFRGSLEATDSPQNSDPITSNNFSITVVSNHNIFNPLDVNSDDSVSPIDALLVINVLNDNGNLSTEIKVDTNGDGQITPLDALLVINGIGTQHTTTTISVDLFGKSPLITIQTTSSDGSGPVVPVAGDNSIDSSDDSTIGTEPPHNPADDSASAGAHVNDSTGDSTDDEPLPSYHHDGLGRRGFGGLGFGGLGFGGLGFGGLGLGLRLGWLSPDRVDSLFERLDDNADDELTEGEVPNRLWNHWVKDNVDSDNNAAISLDELNTAILAQQQAKFDKLDDDGDGFSSSSAGV